MKKIFCFYPFENCEINLEGDVYFCCSYWCRRYSIGNILTDDFDTIWNGEKAKKFRQQFISENYEYCDLSKCLFYFERHDDNIPTLIAKPPKEVRLVTDRSCNLRCIFCRKEYMTIPSEHEIKMHEAIRKMLPKFNENGCIIFLNGAGEVFANKENTKLIKEITENYPKINISIVTNGVLCTEKKLKELNLENRLVNVEVSVHAATKGTYDKLIKGGNFDRVKKNLEYLSKLHKEQKFKNFFLNFTITSENYKEMKKFILWAKKLGASVNFLPLLKIEGNNEEEFERINILNKENKEYKNFVKLMKDPIFKTDNIKVPYEYLNAE